MKFFYQHSTLIIIMLSVIVTGVFILLCGWAACIAGAKADKQSEKFMQKYLNENKKEC